VFGRKDNSPLSDRRVSGDTASTSERLALTRAVPGIEAAVAATAAAAGRAGAQDVNGTTARQRLALLAELRERTAERDPRPRVATRDVESATERLPAMISAYDPDATLKAPIPAVPEEGADDTAERLRLSLIAFEEQEQARAAAAASAAPARAGGSAPAGHAATPAAPAARAGGSAPAGRAAASAAPAARAGGSAPAGRAAASAPAARAPAPSAPEDTSATAERRRLARIVHDERGVARVQWHDAPADHKRVPLSIDEPVPQGKQHGYDPYQSEHRGLAPGAPPPRKRDLRALSDWMKQVREVEQRRRRGDKED